MEIQLLNSSISNNFKKSAEDMRLCLMYLLKAAGQ